MKIQELKISLVNGDVSLKKYYDSLLDKVREENRRLNCCITILESSVERRVAELTHKLSSGEKPGSLFGIPVVVKDNICTRGICTTCGSKILENFVPPYSATVVDRLIEADAVIIAKSNMDEFAMGSSNENSAFGPVLNPRDTTRVPGGSSGGSAAAVAAGLAPFALGSDTGGSLRQPAAFCGVVGLKPTYGAVSRYGLIAFASSMDQIGPIGIDVETTATLFDVISGHDPRDSTSASVPKSDYSGEMQESVRGIRIGLPKEYFAEGLAPSIRNAIDAVIRKLKDEGAELIDASLPSTKYGIGAYYVVADAEASSNLARYDGVKYGLRASSNDLFSMFANTRHEGFGAEVKRRIMLGTYVLSAGYYDAYYQKAMQVRAVIARDFQAAFQKVDLLLTPTTPTTAFKLGEKIDDPLQMYLSDIYTAGVNLAGLPAISVPCGRDEISLPIGLQLIGKHFDEALLFRVGRAVERVVA